MNNNISNFDKEIIFVVGALHGGGAERVVVTLANALALEGTTVTILMVAGSEVCYTVNENVNVISLGNASGKNPIEQIKRLLKMRSFFKAHKNACVNAFSTTINMFTILSTLGLDIHLLVSERNDPNKCSFARLRNFIYSLNRKCIFVFQTPDALQCFSKSIQSRGFVIGNPIREDLPKPFIGTREHRICAAGRLEPQKNHKLLIDAFAKFASSHPDYTLEIYGNGSLLPELAAQVSRLNLTGKVSFPGFKSNIHELINNSSCYVLCSDYEGMPNGLMEAVACGIPSIATDCPIGGSKMILEDTDLPLIPINDVVALATALDEIISTPPTDYSEKILTNYSTKQILSLWKILWQS